jgi:hypothetical protein
MFKPRAMVGAAGGYLKDHPGELLRAAKNAVALRFGLPVDALRWFAGQLNGAKAPRDVEIEAVPPGIRLAASVELMKTPVRAEATIEVVEVLFRAEELRVELRLSGVSLTCLDEASDTPVAALLKSGALDLSRPGDLAAYMPKRPPFLVRAEGDRVVLDLLKHKKLSQERVRKLVALLTPLIVVQGIQTDSEHIDVAFRAFPDGVGEVLSAVRRYL